jgi:hypothetical protein
VEGSARPPQAITTASRSTRSKKVQCDNNNIELGVAAARMDYELADVKSSAPHHALHFTTKPTPTSSQHYDEPRHTTNSTTVFYESNATTNNSEVTKVLEDVTCQEAEEPSPHNHSLTLRFVSVSTHSLQPLQVSSPTMNALIPVFGSSEEADTRVYRSRSEAVRTGLPSTSPKADERGRMSR